MKIALDFNFTLFAAIKHFISCNRETSAHKVFVRVVIAKAFTYLGSLVSKKQSYLSLGLVPSVLAYSLFCPFTKGKSSDIFTISVLVLLAI